MALKSRGIRRRKARRIPSFDRKSVGSKEVEFKVRRVGSIGFTDETGSPVYRDEIPVTERFFGQSVTVVDDDSELIRIMERRRRRVSADEDVSGYVKYDVERGRELKAKTDSDEGRKEVYDDLDSAELWRRGYFVDHTNPPEGWSDNGTKNRKMVFEYTIDHVLEETTGDIHFAVDRCDLLDDRYIKGTLRGRSTGVRKVSGESHYADSAEYGLQLQAQDYSTREMLEELRCRAQTEDEGDGQSWDIEKPYRIRRIDSLSGYPKSLSLRKRRGSKR